MAVLGAVKRDSKKNLTICTWTQNKKTSRKRKTTVTMEAKSLRSKEISQNKKIKNPKSRCLPNIKSNNPSNLSLKTLPVSNRTQ